MSTTVGPQNQRQLFGVLTISSPSAKGSVESVVTVRSGGVDTQLQGPIAGTLTAAGALTVHFAIT